MGFEKNLSIMLLIAITFTVFKWRKKKQKQKNYNSYLACHLKHIGMEAKLTQIMG